MTPTDLQDVRAAAERQLKWESDCLTKPASARYQDGYSSWDDEVVIRNYILATIPPDAEQPVTAEWLRGVWGAELYKENGFEYWKFCTGDAVWLGDKWYLSGSDDAKLGNRHEATTLFTALGIQPQGITPKEGV